MAETLKDVEIFQKADETIRIFRSAVRKAQEENRRLGVANVYWFNGQRYFELPSGAFSRTAPRSERIDADHATQFDKLEK